MFELMAHHLPFTAKTPQDLAKEKYNEKYIKLP
jgi:hypothetical protein